MAPRHEQKQKNNQFDRSHPPWRSPPSSIGLTPHQILLANPHIRGADFSLRLHHVPAQTKVRGAILPELASCISSRRPKRAVYNAIFSVAFRVVPT
jgi:hypothetical protein